MDDGRSSRHDVRFLRFREESAIAFHEVLDSVDAEIMAMTSKEVQDEDW